MASKLRIGIVAKLNHPKSKRLTRDLISFLKRKKINFVLDYETSSLTKGIDCDILKRSELTSKCNIIIVLGGDGTLISACRHPSKKTPTIIGVNLGTLGFLTEITIEEIFKTLTLTIQKKIRIEKRQLFQIEVYRLNKKIKTYFAINDVVITKEALARIFAVRIKINGEFAADLRGDGVIVATPNGSTAYSLAAGGSIVHPQVDAVLITPICPHSLTSRPLILPGSSTIELQLSPENKTKINPVYLTIDGQDGMELTPNDSIKVTSSKYSVNFVKSPTRSYFQILGTKLKWASH